MQEANKKKGLKQCFLQWGSLSKTLQWHILDIVLSPLTLYWVLQGDKKLDRKLLHQKKYKQKRFVWFYTAEPNCANPLSILVVNKTVYITAQPDFVQGGETIPPTNLTKESGCIPWEIPKKNQGTTQHLGPLDPRTRQVRWSTDRETQDHTAGDVQNVTTEPPNCKTILKYSPPFSILCLFLNECRP